MPETDIDPQDTTFLQRIKNGPHTKKIVAGGGGLSAAALVYVHSVFATRMDLEKVRQSETQQWQQVAALRTEVQGLKSQKAAYDFLILYLGGKPFTSGSENTNLAVPR